MELNIEAGLEEIKTRIEQEMQNSCKPVIVSFYGLPNAGKTSLIEQLWAYYKAGYKTVKWTEEFMLPESFEELKRDIPPCDLLLYHIARAKGDIPYRNDMSHINIGVYAPNLLQPRPNGEYDLIIVNSMSKVKVL